MKNSGVLIRELTGLDWVAGAIPVVELNPSGDWQPYLPRTERQCFRYFDSMACVSFSALNCIESQLNFLIKMGRMSVGNLEWLNDQGYLENGLCELSDRFTAKMSGTTPQGNYCGNVWDSIRNHGVVPEKDWKWSDDFDWAKYYAEIPQDIKNKGLEFIKRFETRYEVVLSNNSQVNIPIDLKQAPIQIVALWWDNPVNGIHLAKGCGSGHATTLYKVDDLYRDFDSYDPYFRNLSKDYCIPWAYKGVITEIDLTQYEGKVLEGEDGKAYLIKDGKKKWSPDLITFFSHNLTTDLIIKVKNRIIEQFPDGGQLQFKGSPHEKLFLNMKEKGVMRW